MEKFYLEEPSLERKDAAIEYINEFYEKNSKIHGVGSLDRYVKENNYEEWLIYKNNMNDKNYANSVNKVPSVTYFLIRENDNKIIGMLDLRLELNDYLRTIGGHIGYSIRPSERRNGYAKIQLYLGLLKSFEYNISDVMISCDKSNIGSNKTIQALGGVFSNNIIDPDDGEEMNIYWINVNNSIEKYKHLYEENIYERVKKNEIK